MSSSLHLQQCPVCLVRLTWMVLEMGSKWPYNSCFLGCCFLDLFNIARSIPLQLPSSLFSIRFVSVHVEHPYCSIDMIVAREKSCFILLDRSDFYMIDSLSIAVPPYI